MPLRTEPSLVGAGAHELGSVSSFGEEEPLRLPFDLQRHHLFLLAVAIVAMVVVAAGAGLSPLIGAGLVVAVALAFAVALNEMFGLVLLAALVPATAGLAKGVPLPGVRLSQAVAGGVAVILLVSARRIVRWTALDWLALLYAVATLVLGGWDQLHGSKHFGLGQIELLLGPFQFLLLYRATALTAHTPERRRLVLRIVLWASVPVALLAIGQQFNVPGIRSLLVSLTHNDVYAPGQTARATGPFPLWHNLAAYLFMVLLIIAALLIRRVSGVLSRPVLIAIAVVNAIALVETLSIAPIAGVIVGAAIIGIWHRGLGRVMVALVAVLAIGLVVFGSRIDARYASEWGQAPGEARSAAVPQTVQYRYDLWTNQLLPLLKGHVLTGYGPDLPAQLQNFPFTESLYINLLYKGGVILLVVWITLFTAMGLAAFRASRDRDPLQQALGAAVVAAIVCLIFMQALESDFTDDGMPQVLWMLLGLLAFREVAATAVGSRVRGALEDARRQRAWAGNVAMALQSLDPGSRELLTLSYHHGLDDDEVVGVMGLSPRAIARWRQSALRRLALRTHMTPPAVERVLRSGSGARG
jgi:O-antigen ligase